MGILLYRKGDYDQSRILSYCCRFARQIMFNWLLFVIFWILLVSSPASRRRATGFNVV